MGGGGGGAKFESGTYGTRRVTYGTRRVTHGTQRVTYGTRRVTYGTPWDEVIAFLWPREVDQKTAIQKDMWGNVCQSVTCGKCDIRSMRRS